MSEAAVCAKPHQRLSILLATAALLVAAAAGDGGACAALAASVGGAEAAGAPLLQRSVLERGLGPPSLQEPPGADLLIDTGSNGEAEANVAERDRAKIESSERPPGVSKTPRLASPSGLERLLLGDELWAFLSFLVGFALVRLVVVGYRRMYGLFAARGGEAIADDEG